jgi:methylenetetrahydrofolate dehydrogenase (NADP+) / methenyltetrahydrofolate cyclohydrolase
MLLDGHKIATLIHDEIKEALGAPFPRKPCLAAVLTSQNPASLIYVGRKVKACEHVGIESQVFHLEPQDTKELIAFIQKLNLDPKIDGILIQLPLPRKINLLEVLESIDPTKDVDGFHPLNVGRVLLQDPNAFYPCTPLGIKVLLEKHDIKVEGQHVVIVGRSNIVGKPLAALLLHDAPGCNATVTVAHSHSKNLKEITLSADILVVAIGKPHFIGADMVREGAVVVDVGSSKIGSQGTKSGFRVVGDVAYDSVRHKCSAITPVPGGVGPMTIAMLLKNTLKSFLSHVEHQ